MTEQSQAGRRPKDQKRIPLSVRITPQTRVNLLASAAQTGRSITQEAEARLDESFAERAYPPEVGAMAELLARAMAEVGSFITGANFWSGHRPGLGQASWINDGYAYDQAMKAALHILLLGRPDGPRAPHGLFPTFDTQSDNPNLSRQIGRQVADGILEVMRGRHRPEDGGRAALWTGRVREKLGTLGERLDRQPEPDEYFGTSATGDQE
jgi:hypothetical protein